MLHTFFVYTFLIGAKDQIQLIIMNVIETTQRKEYAAPEAYCFVLMVEGVLCHSNEGVEFEDWN